MINPSAEGGSKPFNGYQPPSGYSPWQQLYTSQTNNGTVSPYINNVRPQLDQQNFNAHVSEQINGVQTGGVLRGRLARRGASTSAA